MDFIEKFKEQVERVKEKFKENIAAVRSNKISLETISKTIIRSKKWSKHLEKIASISAYSSDEYSITPFEETNFKAIKENFSNSDFGYKIEYSDNKTIRVSLAPVTFERRNKIIESCKEQLEESKKALRTLRIKAIKESKKEKSSDQERENQRTIELIMKEISESLQLILNRKSKELLST